MAGGPTTPELVAAVSNAGGLGCLGAAAMAPEAIRDAVRKIKSLTEKPFAVNLFVLAETTADPASLRSAMERLQPWRAELGMSAAPIPNRFAESFDEQFAALLDAAPPVASFHFDLLPRDKLAALRKNHIIVIGSATTAEEARKIAADADIVVAQGSESGGHRGTFLGSMEESLIGTAALVPQIVDAVKIPVLAAGGIMDGRGIVAALALGASGVQMGTAFLACREAGTHPLHKAALTAKGMTTVVTRTVSGRHARGLRNRMLTEFEPIRDQIPAYPIQNALTTSIRAEAAKQGRQDLMVMWAGQGHAMATAQPAARLMAGLVKDTEKLLKRLGSVRSKRANA
jgi:nitronate monooxygenase